MITKTESFESSFYEKDSRRYPGWSRRRMPNHSEIASVEQVKACRNQYWISRKGHLAFTRWNLCQEQVIIRDTLLGVKREVWQAEEKRTSLQNWEQMDGIWILNKHCYAGRRLDLSSVLWESTRTWVCILSSHMKRSCVSLWAWHPGTGERKRTGGSLRLPV